MEYFEYNSYSLGWLDCYFLTNKTFTESQAERYLNLLKTFNKTGDENILKFIKIMYPKLTGEKMFHVEQIKNF